MTPVCSGPDQPGALAVLAVIGVIVMSISAVFWKDMQPKWRKLLLVAGIIHFLPGFCVLWINAIL